MKNSFIILLSMLCAGTLSSQAQSKKPGTKTTTKNMVITSKKALAKEAITKKSTSTITSSKSAPVKTGEKVVAKSSTPIEKHKKANLTSSSYKTALGLKFIYGISLTGKFFVKENAALEGIFRINGAGGLGTNMAFTGLFEHYANIKSVEGLRWYAGGGAYVNYFSWKDNLDDSVVTYGISGILGLEYKLANLPLAISADWVPGYVISNNIGFSAENGGLGIKYTF